MLTFIACVAVVLLIAVANASPVTLTSAQKLAIGFTILDKGGEAFTFVPPGHVVTFESSDPSVVGVATRPDGLNADLSSDNVGVAIITASAIKPDGTHMPGSPETLEVTVVHADPDGATFTVGAPEPETPPVP